MVFGLHIDSEDAVDGHEPPADETGAVGDFNQLMDRAAADWGLPRRVVDLIVVLPILIVLFGCVTALLGKTTYNWFVAEDGVAETAQVIAFGFSAVASFVLGYRLNAAGGRWLGVLFLLGGFSLLWVVGEELSWGQRVMGVATPESLQGVNRQGELNLHNIRAVEDALRLAQFLVGLWATVLPLAVLRYGSRFKTWAREQKLFIPHYSLILYFAGTMVWRAYHAIGSPAPESLRYVVSEWAEVIELLLALGIGLHFFYLLRTLGTGDPVRRGHAGA